MNIVTKLDDENLWINLPKSHLAKTGNEWLGFIFSPPGKSPLEKTSAVLNPSATKNLMQLKSFLDSVQPLGKINPNLLQLCQLYVVY